MVFVLCSSAFVICLALQVSSQPPDKPIGEWHPDKPQQYPNPWENAVKCKTETTSGLCDANAMLSDDDRIYFSEQQGMLKVDNDDGCLCNTTCGAQIRINVTVAVMKKIGPQITDYRAAGAEFTQKFKDLWKLPDCSVILIVSYGDNSSVLEAGSDVKKLLPANTTEDFDWDIYNRYFTKGLFVDGINNTLIAYRNWTEIAVTMAVTTEKPPESTKKPPESTEKPPESTDQSGGKVIVGVVVAVLVVVILIVIVIIVIKQRRKRSHKVPTKDKEGERLTPVAV